MSLTLNEDEITEVLLPDGKWYQVCDKSFTTSSYEFNKGKEQFGIGILEGAVFVYLNDKRLMDTETIYCPLTSVMAIKVRRKRKEEKADANK